MYGDDGVLCWIAKRHLKWQIFLFYIPLWIAVLWNIVVGRLVTREFHRVFKLGTAGRAMVHVHRLNLYPLVLLGCWGVGSISSVVQWVAGGDCPFWVTALQVMCWLFCGRPRECLLEDMLRDCGHSKCVSLSVAGFRRGLS